METMVAEIHDQHNQEFPPSAGEIGEHPFRDFRVDQQFPAGENFLGDIDEPLIRNSCHSGRDIEMFTKSNWQISGITQRRDRSHYQTQKNNPSASTNLARRHHSVLSNWPNRERRRFVMTLASSSGTDGWTINAPEH
jgi:hypothetical protein